MDTHQQHEQEQKQPSDEQVLQALIDGADDEANGVTVVRSNTPRPLSFAHSASKGEHSSAASYSDLADFPIEAPAAPPLPEEPEESQSGAPVATASIALPTPSEQAGTTTSEFIWLFEYGLEMDEGYLNSVERLNGQALHYGPAVLTGYVLAGMKLQNGQTAFTLARASSRAQEVWGVLYRIPRRLAEQSGPHPSVLDNVYAARLFKATPVIVQEMYRKRMVQCTTYMLPETASKDGVVSIPIDAHFDSSYTRRLLEVARQQHLPAAYLHEVATLTGQPPGESLPLVSTRVEQNTEPLPVVAPGALNEHIPDSAQNSVSEPTPRGWLIALALYLVGVLMATLALAVIQTLGYWNQLFSVSFAPLGAPWYVLLYGLLGGCISCIMTLGRSNRPIWPGFVILTWFVRPFLGLVLAALAYLVLSSGMFVLSDVPAQRYAICSVAAAIAGLCERWLFFRKK